MDWKQWVLWLVGLLMDRWVEIAVGVVVITVWRWFMGRKFDRQATDHKKQIDALAAAVADRSQTSPTVVVNVGEHEPEAVDRTSGDREAVKINPGNGWRVARLILEATLDEAETLFHDFMSQPHKDREERVFAAYWVRTCKLRGLSGQACWQQTAFAAVEREQKSGASNFWERTIPEVGEIFQEVYGDADAALAPALPAANTSKPEPDFWEWVDRAYAITLDIHSHEPRDIPTKRALEAKARINDLRTEMRHRNIQVPDAVGYGATFKTWYLFLDQFRAGRPPRITDETPRQRDLESSEGQGGDGPDEGGR